MLFKSGLGLVVNILQNPRHPLGLSHSTHEKCHVYTMDNLSVRDEKTFESVAITLHICRINVNPGQGKNLFKNKKEMW